MIEITLLIVTAVSTFFAAVAAGLSYLVTNNSLKFQKNYGKNQSLIQNLHRTINTATNIKTLMQQNPLDIADEDYELIEPLLSQLKSELLYLSNAGAINYEELKVSSINTVYDLAREKPSLDEVIKELESSVNVIFI